MIEINGEVIKKILLYKDLKSEKIKNKDYLEGVIKDLEESIALYEAKNKKYAEFIKKRKYENLEQFKFYNFKKYYKKLSRKRN